MLNDQCYGQIDSLLHGFYNTLSMRMIKPRNQQAETLNDEFA